MKSFYILLLLTPFIIFAKESVIHDDGTGAKISFFLPTHSKWKGKDIEYTTFRISVKKNEAFLLFFDLPGKKTNDGQYFAGTIIIPSNFINFAEIILLGSPKNSSIGITKKLKVMDFKKIIQKKSWTKEDTLPNWNQEDAEKLIGKYILIGITYVDSNNNVTKRKQLHGIIKRISKKKGILVSLKGVNKGQNYNLPPDYSNFHKASTGSYHLRSTNENIENLDLTTIWTINSP